LIKINNSNFTELIDEDIINESVVYETEIRKKKGKENKLSFSPLPIQTYLK